jgi:hypothetical protein
MPPLYCPACATEKEEQYQLIRTLIREHPGINAVQVHEQTGVPMSVIMQHIENGDFALYVNPSSRADIENI